MKNLNQLFEEVLKESLNWNDDDSDYTYTPPNIDDFQSGGDFKSYKKVCRYEADQAYKDHKISHEEYSKIYDDINSWP